MNKIIGLGEILIDFTPMPHQTKPTFVQNAGGAPANVLTCASKMGIPTTFIGCVGNDGFGNFLKDFLTNCNIDFTYLKTSDEYHTTLAFVHLHSDGDRDFHFYRNHGADKQLSEKDIPISLFNSGDIFHFGSLSMTDEPSRSATKKALHIAKEKGCLISYDPNLRPLLWKNLQQAKETILSVMDPIDILKVSEEELSFLTEEKTLPVACARLATTYELPLIIVTMGENGSAFYHNHRFHHVKGYPVNAVDTTGAGDSHLGAVLSQILRQRQDISALSSKQLTGFVDFANKTAALVTTRYGSAEIMPTRQEVLEASMTALS